MQLILLEYITVGHLIGVISLKTGESFGVVRGKIPEKKKNMFQTRPDENGMSVQD